MPIEARLETYGHWQKVVLAWERVLDQISALPGIEKVERDHSQPLWRDRYNATICGSTAAELEAASLLSAAVVPELKSAHTWEINYVKNEPTVSSLDL